MRIGFIIGLLILSLKSFAFHIVGGEIEFITLDSGLYRINIIQYFDKAQEDNPGPEPSALVYIFSNRNHEVISTHVLTLIEEKEVSYTNLECEIDELKTSKVVWSVDIELDPRDYAHEEGYYIVWERCCRNEQVINIVYPEGQGMKYIVEIPPLWKNGAPYINSSPSVFPPLSDYACVGQLYYADFSGVDLDGDSLVYSMVSLLNSSAQAALPTPKPKPHLDVFFSPGFNVNNMIPGTPPLGIDSKGLLTVKPIFTGLFVFSVLVEEYRSGIKIGEVRRDFQMLVVDDCNPPDPPVVGIEIPGNPTFDSKTDTLVFAFVEPKCFEFTVSNITPGETISLEAEPVNFTGDVSDIFSITSQFIRDEEILRIEVCAPGCPPTGEEPFIIDLIAKDDACPLPQLDTLRLTIQVEPPPNQLPITTLTDESITINENDTYEINFSASDPDNNEMSMILFAPYLENPEDHGMFLEELSNEPGSITGRFSWDTNCLLYDFSEQSEFRVGIIIEDADSCLATNTEITWLDLNVILPPNTNPFVEFIQLNESSITHVYGEQVSVGLKVTDDDGDIININIDGIGFNPEKLNVEFENTTGVGSISSSFNWEVSCDLYSKLGLDEYTFLFIGDDEDKCQIKNYDTLALTIELQLPPNNRPEFTRTPDYRLRINEPFELEIKASDADLENLITLDFLNRRYLPVSNSLKFEPITEKGQVTSMLRWTPECSLLKPGSSSSTYRIIFSATDDVCPIPGIGLDTISFEIYQDTERFKAFSPPNVFTPNRDGKNDVYTLVNLSDPSYNLPSDLCGDKFQYVTIYDRSGKEVFKSQNREFKWKGDNLPAGTYYVYIKFEKSEFKNFIQLLR